ncbi:MAG: hypothetical protein CR984_04605 [Proteobacteria bacterium]|nr:MAG: hypothetical protein CR984_04605 [Pseudomonadota bacterium]
MKRLLFFALIVASCFAVTENAFADWAFHIGNDNMDETWEVFLITNETLQVGGYSLSFAYDYDPSALNWVDTSYTNTPPPGMNSGFGSPTADGSGGISNFNGNSDSFPSAAEVFSDAQIGSFTLDYNGGRTPAIGDFGWYIDQPDFLVRVNGTDYSGTELYEAGHLTTATLVPLPGSGVLLLLGGTSLMVIAGVRRIQMFRLK